MRRKPDPSAFARNAANAEAMVHTQDKARPASDAPRDVKTAADISYKLEDPVEDTMLMSGSHEGQRLSGLAMTQSGRSYLAGIFPLVPKALQAAITKAICEQ